MILKPHWQQTEQRTAEQAVVLCLQDTTELDFNGQQARGGSTSTGHDRARRTRVRPVSGRSLAHCTSDEDGSYMPGPGRPAVL